MEEFEKRQNELAKMRSLLYKHEFKAKHLAKIKSKDYHRRLKKTAKAKVSLVTPAGIKHIALPVLTGAFLWPVLLSVCKLLLFSMLMANPGGDCHLPCDRSPPDDDLHPMRLNL